jgi:hypothetical protein
MGWFKDLFTGGVGDAIGSIGKAIDDNVTSDEERLILRNELEKIKSDTEVKGGELEQQYESELSKRNEADSKSDSWLTKNIRPMTLIFLMVNTMAVMYITIFADLPEDKVEMVKAWIPLLIALDVTAVGFYFGGRSTEKIKALIPKY